MCLLSVVRLCVMITFVFVNCYYCFCVIHVFFLLLLLFIPGHAYITIEEQIRNTPRYIKHTKGKQKHKKNKQTKNKQKHTQKNNHKHKSTQQQHIKETQQTKHNQNNNNTPQESTKQEEYANNTNQLVLCCFYLFLLCVVRPCVLITFVFVRFPLCLNHYVFLFLFLLLPCFPGHA